MTNIISKLKESKLLGRSGSRFPAGLKWEMVKNQDSDVKYVVCNAAEGEMMSFKDYFILKEHTKTLIKGIKLALEELSAKKGYIYLNEKYFDDIKDLLEDEIKDENIEIVKKKGGYVGGEETVVMEVIEGNNPEPRIKPPFPIEKGLWGKPTLVNNVETFYYIAKINEGNFENEKFYSVQGDVPNKGVYEFKEDTTIREVLDKTENTPSFDYFLQVGGGSCGEIILPDEIDKPLRGLGSIIVYNKNEDPYLLMKRWADYLLEGNCDKCTPCREGLYRIREMIDERNLEGVDEIFDAMKKTSLCPLGKSAVTPFKTLLEKVL